MKKILYIGNNLNQKNNNVSSIHTLGALLEKENYILYYASSKNNKFLRLMDMIWTCFVSSKTTDYVLIDTYSTLNFYYAFIISQLCRLLKLRYIPILHGGNLPKRLANSPWMSKSIFKPAYKNVSPSLYLMEVFKNNGYTNSLHIPNTLQIEKYLFEERNFNEINLLWVRSFSEVYNPSLAIKVLKKLIDEGFNASLCMVGPDKDGTLAKVKQLAKQLEVDVTFTGKLTKEKWIAESRKHNVFMNTSNLDNMPISVMEAMALGLPVVSTKVGGLPYLITNNKEGFLVEKNNVNLFVHGIKKIISNPSTTKIMVVHARQKVEAFDWECVKLKWFELL